MALTRMQIELVQYSFEQIAPRAEAAARLFYDRLFELDPSLRPLFRIDSREQERKLIQMLGLAVYALDHMDWLRASMQALGERHGRYGVQPQHYVTLGLALLWTLEQSLGPEIFTPEVKTAWAKVYGLLVEAATTHLNAEPA